MPKSNDFSLTIFSSLASPKKKKGMGKEKCKKRYTGEREREREKCKKKYTVKGKKIGLVKPY